MADNKIIEVLIFGIEVGKLGYDLDKDTSYFQYNPSFLDSNRYSKLFPFIFKRNKAVQVFTNYGGETFRGLPPMIADSLPDVFGNIIFKKWLESKNRNFEKITPIEQLCYVANRGMGALEYRPAKELPKSNEINIEEIADILNQVLDLKAETSEQSLNEDALLNIFKMGTSAGGLRPKILVSEHINSGKIIPGDLVYSSDYNHYLVKLCLNEENSKEYNKEKIEYAYYLMAKAAGIQMMPSKLINDKHFATVRFDRQNGEKQHVLTASGLTGWNYKNPEESSYENVFELALGLKVPFKDLKELYRRMIFNLVVANTDDHLKNHSFIYDKKNNSWNIAPAYDLTYPLNINLNFTKVSRALSINNKRSGISIKDLLSLAETFVIKNPKGILKEVLAAVRNWNQIAEGLNIPKRVINQIQKEFSFFE